MSKLDLVGTAEVAAMLGVHRSRVGQLRGLATFPRPVAALAATPVWHRRDIEAWAATWQRTPGRPRTREDSSS